MSELTSSLIHGRYEVMAVVGRGGEGTLVRAVDRRHGRDVALKLRRVPDDPRDAERLMVESRTLLSLQPHPGLPLARDDFFEGDRHALVMDWVDGVDLEALLTEHGQPGLPPSTVLRWLAPVAEALTHLHTTDPPIVHGDVKPANLVLTPNGRVVLVDFGVSSTPGLRPRGGTPGYRAPEVAAGGLPTRAADVYGLAATAFALLAGAPPSGILPSWAEVDPDRAARLEHALRRGLATNPVNRTATPGELVEELRAGWDAEALPTGVLTFLATDVVSSTRLWQDVPDIAPGLLAEHLLVVDRAVERHGGRRIGDTIQGDATMSVFHRASDAVRAGIDLQRDLAGGRVQVHCATHTGEAIDVDGVPGGATVSRVARIRGFAEAGQVLVSETTARLAQGDLSPDVRFVELGPHRLDGFDEPENLLAVQAEGLVVPPDPAEPPYRGLVPYDVDDDETYFGRDREIETCLQRLAAVSFLAVVGPSGCGKSSLIRAGVASRLRQAGRAVAVFNPGPDPRGALAAALATAGPRSALLVDQLEELFAPDIAPDIADQFLDALVQRLDSAPVIVALRADHVGSVGRHPAFARRLEAGLHLVTPMTEDELRAAVEGPAHAAGLRLEPGLVELLLSDVRDEPGGLPLLSFALSETWSNRDGRLLTVDGYLATGGLRRAIATSAERLFEGLPPNQRPLAKALFLRLVTPAPGGEPVRQRVKPSSIVIDDEHRHVVDVFVRTRLVVAGDNGLELAHEALVREWPRLRTWLDDDVEGQLILRHLAVTADAWESMTRPDSELYRGTRLAQAAEWQERADPDLRPVERTFLAASRARADDEQREAHKRARQQARANRRLRVLLGGVAALLVIAVIAGLLALDQRRNAEQERREATARELAAASDANLADDPERSILLALAAIDATRSSDGTVLPEAEEALHRAVTSSRIVLSVPGIGGIVDWSPEGSIFVTEGPEESGVIDIRDAETGESVRSFHGHDIDVNHVAFSSDGSMLATTGDDSAVRVWEPTTGEELSAFQDADGGAVVAPAFSPDGSRLVASWPNEDAVRVIDRVGGDTITEIEFPDVFDTAFSPDGQRLAMASDTQASARVVDVDSGQPLFTLDGHDDAVFTVAWSPDGRWLATGSLDSTARIWDGETGEHRFTMTSHTVAIPALDWSADSTRLATGSDDGTARVWEVTEDGTRELLSFAARGTSHNVVSVAFSPDGQRLMTSDSAISAVKIWDASTTGGAEWANVPAVPRSHAKFTRDSRGLVVSSGGGVVPISDVETGDRVAEIGPRADRDDDVYWLDLTADGQLLATTAPFAYGPVDVWETSTGEHRFAVNVDNGEDVAAWDLEWSGNGRLLAIALNDGRRGEVAIVDRSGAEVARIHDEPGQHVTSVSLSPDGRLLATTRQGIARNDTQNMDLTIWDWERGEVVSTFEGPLGHATFDATGTRIAAVRIFDGTAEVWDLQTGDKVATLVPPVATGALALSRDGTSAATGHLDGSVRLWDTETGIERLALHGHQGEVTSVAFSADGSMLASNDTAGLARVWALELDELIAIATDRLTRTLTEDECRQFLHVERCPTT